MSAQQITVLALAAVLMFWAVGAYNRLVALRNDIASAWAKVDAALAQRRAAAEPLLAALREPLSAEEGALDAWQAAMGDAARAAAAVTARPVAPVHTTAWVGTEVALSAAASRVLALLEQQPELRQHEAIAMPVLGWLESSKRLRFARQLYNEAAAPYDEAIATFPTRLLVRAFRFGPAGRL
ncbi:MAG: LemA family protein [Leptothrix sp. (in: Bacteria)]|nr:LemA family protein [Leptothrix sp. (in: b-proteobacteria)]